jgi:hypothetical protein
MKNVAKSFGIFLVASFACGAVPATGQRQPKFTRTIAGVVVDKDEQPVADAKVRACVPIEVLQVDVGARKEITVRLK